MEKPSPLIMLHGLMGTQSFYSPTEHIRTLPVYTPDLIGYGELQIDSGTPITLERQAGWVIEYLRGHVRKPSWLLGHSVGGAVAMLAAWAAPELVRGVISAEGNFTLNDAFWCTKIAALSEEEWAVEHRRILDDPAGWLESAGVALSPQRLVWAREMLLNQPHTTIQSMARAVVGETGVPGYLEKVRAVVEHGTPIYLLAGSRSASEWDVPEWVRDAARDYVVQQDVGHMMMLEQPETFCRIVSGMVAGGLPA
jgi:pimeloyl-ACP methyl ester carboxylesterase